MAYSGSGARYGIWGENPYGPSAFDKSLDVAQAMGKLGEQSTQARLSKLAAEQQQMQNQYTPQNEAIKLSGALNALDQQAWQRQRFGSDAYTMSKLYGMLPVELKLKAAQDPAFAAHLDTMLQNQAAQTSGSSMNGGQGMPGQQSPYAQQAANVLTPFMQGRGQPMGQDAQVQQNLANRLRDMQATHPGQQIMMNNGQPQQQMQMQQPGVQTPQSQLPETKSAEKKPGALAQGFTEVADAALEKKLRNTDQQKRIDAGGRIEIPLQKITQNYMPLVSQYTGPTGKADFLADAAASAAGKTSPRFQAFLNMKNDLELAKGDLSVVLGKRATDEAAREINRVLNVDYFASNAAAALKTYQNVMDTVKQTIELNKLTTNKVLKKNDIDITKSREAGWHDGAYYDGKGNAYTRAQLEKLAGGKK